MTAGHGRSRGVTILPMTEIVRNFVLNGIGQQGKDVTPRFSEKDVGRAVVTQFANTEIQVVCEAELNGRDVIIFLSYEPPISERLWELELTMQAVKLAGADRITVVACYAPYSRGDKKDQRHGSIGFKAFVSKLNLYEAGLIAYDLHAPATLGFFDYPSRMLSLRDVLMEEARRNSDYDVVVATDVGGVKRTRKWADNALCPGHNLGTGVVDKRRTGNDDTAMADRYFGDSVCGKKVLMIDDEAATLGTMISAARVLEGEGACEIRAAAYHGVLSGPAIERLVDSPIVELVVTNTIPVSLDKIEQANGKLRVVDISSFAIEAARRWYAGKSLSSMIEYAY